MGQESFQKQGRASWSALIGAYRIFPVSWPCPRRRGPMVEASIEKGAIVYRIVIDQSLCSGFGVCAELAPEVIEVAPGGLARLRVGSSADPKVVEAASACPMAA